MGPERRRSPRFGIREDDSNAVVRGEVAVGLRDISVGGLGFRLDASVDPGAVYPLTALLRGLSLATAVRITRCRPCEPAGAPLAPGDGRRWDAGAEFLWRDECDAAAVRRWLERRSPGST